MGILIFWAAVCLASPIRFVENVVHDAEIKYHAKIRGVEALFWDGGASFVFPLFQRDEALSRPYPYAYERWDLTFGEKKTPPEALWHSSEKVRYHLNSIEEKTARVAEVLVYRDVFPGVDMRFYGAEGGMKFDFVLRPGAEPENIRLSLSGPGKPALAHDVISVETTEPGAVFRFQPPVSWAKNHKIYTEYLPFSDGEFGFCVDEVPDEAWVIDPLILLGAGFYGGSDYDEIHAVGVDSLGNAYAVGTTFSVNFPKLSAWQSFLNNRPNSPGNCDVSLLCWDLQTGRRKWATYFGGARNDLGKALTVTPGGKTMIFGTSSSENLPVYLPYQGDYGGLGDGFAAVFDAQGRLVRASFMGGNGEDHVESAALAPDGLSVFVGTTSSNNLFAFGGFSQRNLGQSDVFIAALDSNLTPRRLFYFGGSDQDYGKSVAINDSGVVFVAGETVSDYFPRFGERDVFVAAFDGGALLDVAGVGGIDRDECAAVLVSPNGKVHVFGHTFSENYPVSGTAFGKTRGGKCDWSLAVFDFQDSMFRLQSSGVFGGDGWDFAHGAALRKSDHTLVFVGETYSQYFGSDYQKKFGGGETDGAVFWADTLGRVQLFSYYGGGGNDALFAAAFSNSQLIVAGKTESPDLFRSDYFQQTNLSALSFDGCVAVFDGRHPLGRAEGSTFSELELSPNPVYGSKTVLSGNNAEARRGVLKLYDVHGKAVAEYAVFIPAGMFAIELAIPDNLENGYYFVEGRRLLLLR